MKKRHASILVCPVVLLFGGVFHAAALDPPPPVNQKIGMPDGVYNNLVEADCRMCHRDPTNANPKLMADRHHLKKGLTVPESTVAPNGTPGGVYECATCHWNVLTNAHDETIPLNDCLICHPQETGIVSVHHLTARARARDCKGCHGTIINNPDDGHYIPTYRGSLITPQPGMGTGPAGIGGCAFCHAGGMEIIPGWTAGFQVYSTADTHHGSGVVPGPFTNGFTPECALCHNTDPASTAPKIRACQHCHGIDTLHFIQTDSNADCMLMCCTYPEKSWHGHVGTKEDCKGCHGPYFSAAATAPSFSGAIMPHIETLSAYSVAEGGDSLVRLTGSAFTNYSQINPVDEIILYSNVTLLGDNGRQYNLSPAKITEDAMEIVLPPYMEAGNYELKAVKFTQKSNRKRISVIPEVKIYAAACAAGQPAILTLKGKDYNRYVDGSKVDISVTMRGEGQSETCGIATLTDTDIIAHCGFCGNQVKVDTLFTSVLAPIGAPAECLNCHADLSARLNCRNRAWRKHAGTVNRASYWAAEMTYLGYLCENRAGTYPPKTVR